MSTLLAFFVLAAGIPEELKSWPDYRAVWRWHFYAGLFCIPFVIVLSTSGLIYLFKPQIEAWNDRHYDNLQLTGSVEAASEQVAAAIAAVPGSSFSSYELPESESSSARIVVKNDETSIRAYVHPETVQVLHTVPDGERFMRWVFRLHGELWPPTDEPKVLAASATDGGVFPGRSPHHSFGCRRFYSSLNSASHYGQDSQEL